ncbi:MAG: PIN domain-containing protein [Dehalococcoidia bacterium]
MTSDSTALLVDTNLPVYAVDPRDAFKQQRAIDVLDRIDSAHRGTVGVQNLNEFISVSTRRLVPPMSMEETVRVVRYFLRYWRVLPLTPHVTVEAIRGVELHHLSWWDSLIWATAYVNDIQTVVSEDFNPGSVLDGVRFVNPFDPAFTIADL